MQLKLYGLAALCAAVMITAAAAPSSAAAQSTTTPERAALITQIESLMKLIADLQKQINDARENLEDIIKAGLEEGMQDDDVRKVQELLSTDPNIYPEGIVSGYFGPMTREALKRFQMRHELAVTGKLDEQTRDLIKEFRKERVNDKVPPGLLRSEEARKRVLERLQKKWGENCDLNQPGRGKNCEKPWKDKAEDDEDEEEEENEEEEEEEDDTEVTRDDARREMADAQRDIAQFRSDVREASRDGSHSTDAIKAAVAVANAAAKKLTDARRAFSTGGFEQAFDLADEAREMIKDADEALDDEDQDDADEDNDEEGDDSDDDTDADEDND